MVGLSPAIANELLANAPPANEPLAAPPEAQPPSALANASSSAMAHARNAVRLTRSKVIDASLITSCDIVKMH
jgi:hypothetical protein